MGITQQSKPIESVGTLANLALLTGNLGVPGGGLYPLRIYANSQGMNDMGLLPDYLPGYQPVSNGQRGLTLTEMVPALREGRLQALFVIGENIVRSYPDPLAAQAAFEAAQFVVVSDLFMTETAELADVVLPAAAPQEKDGTYTNVERRIQRLHQALESPGDAQPDWKTLTALAQLMGAQGFDYRHPSQIMDEIARNTPIYAGVSYVRLEGEGLQWPCPSPDHPGTSVLFVDGFAPRAKLTRFDSGSTADQPSPNGHLSLLMTQNRYQFHTGDQTRRVPGLIWFYPRDRVEVHPDDAARLGIGEGDQLRIASASGEALAEARLSDDAPQGALVLTNHFEANQLLASAPVDEATHTPALKALQVTVEKA
jgi:predicted molibdopterin-dependent oxidoreductase YjgC